VVHVKQDFLCNSEQDLLYSQTRILAISGVRPWVANVAPRSLRCHMAQAVLGLGTGGVLLENLDLKIGQRTRPRAG